MIIEVLDQVNNSFNLNFQIRELGGLRLVLEHTNIDGRNPCILLK